MLLLASCSPPSQPSTSAGSHQTSTTAPPLKSSTGSAPPDGDRLTAISFLNPMQGYGVFTGPGDGGCEVRVGSTTDGGATFGPLVSVVSDNCTGTGSVQSLAFDDHGDGFLYGPDLWLTHDAGRTWVKSLQPGSVLSVEALGLSVWMVEAVCPASSPPPACPLRLSQSIDGGRTWSVSSLPAGANSAPFLGNGIAGQTWLARVSQSGAYLLGYPANPTTQTDSAPLWSTTDAGTSWSRRSIPCGTNSLYVALSVAPGGVLLAVCRDPTQRRKSREVSSSVK